jgi:2,3-bisphosphoglycerate-independent phosphoglycerate mutase
MDLELLRDLAQPNTTKIVLCSLDGLGGLPRPESGKSELETARLPNLHALAARSACGLLRHVGPGITPGSGPGHLGLFGYDPLQHPVGRGVLEALGIDFPLKPGDVAARGNFCTVDTKGRITDRRAGRISTDLCVKLCEQLRAIAVDGVEIVIEPVKEHRFVLVLRGQDLTGRLSETDPQALGKPPQLVRALEPAGERTAAFVNQFVERARVLLKDAAPANMVLLRGFDTQPDLPLFPEIYSLRAGAIAAYPMYRGLARLVGMDVLETGPTFVDEIATLRGQWTAHDFFFLHYKDTDKAGEDGDFDAKVAALERFDTSLPAIQALEPDVLAVSGDHSTPSVLAAHGWQPVPALVSSRYCGADHTSRFTERDCAGGALGIMPAQELMPILMANAMRLAKYGA